MTKPWHVDGLQCRGSAYDIGRQMAEGFKQTARGRAYSRRKERRPFAFSLKNAEAALKTRAPNIWEELHGLCVGLHMVSEATWKPGLVCILLVRMALDQCATTREAVALLRRVPHGTGFNYSLVDGLVTPGNPSTPTYRDPMEPIEGRPTATLAP